MRFLAAISGFGAFEKVLENPSGALARRLAEQAPDGWDVRARELPVSFRRGPTAFDELLAGMDRAPDLLFAMGVHKKPGFRIERIARGAPVGKPGRSDNDGDAVDDLAAEPGDFASDLPVERFAEQLGERLGVEAFVSEDAGGYVCERVYHRVLSRAAERTIPGLFLHVPPLKFTDLEGQERALRELFALLREELSLRARARGESRPS